MNNGDSVSISGKLPADEGVDRGRRAFLKTGLGLAGATMFGIDRASSAPAFPGASDAIRTYQVDWSPQRLDALRRKIRSFQFPRSIPGSGWNYGMDPDYLRSMVDHWADRFDMEGAARNLNRFPQYVTKVGNIDVHFIRVIGEGGPNKARLPLLCTHGWPGSTFEFWDSIEPLAFPSRFGAASEIAFDLIIPSLPGHGFSGKPVRPIGARTTAGLWNKLMRENLGYETYYAQGGDWGAGVTGWLALDYPEVVKAIHLNLMIVAPQVVPKTDAERGFFAKAEEDERVWGAYYQMQATEPQSIAYAIADNPVAQAAWIVQRFYEWSDKRTQSFDQIYTMDQMLTNVMIYVMNDAFQTSTWFYTGSHEEGVKTMPAGKRVGVPTGYAFYGGDNRSPAPPRSIVEQGYNLQHWYEVPQGGHFAAMEVPKLYVEGLRGWAKSLKL